MQGRALTPDVILSGNLSVSKTVNLQDKVIYTNGQYEADEGYDGLGKVTVDVHNEMTDLKVTENGVYLPPEGYDGFDSVDVDVPDPELDVIYITQNGRYTPPAGVVGYDDIHVNVNMNLESKTITANGHYEPSQGKNGFSDVTVNVPERVPVIESKSITENGTYTAPAGVDGYSPITVNVPLPANAYLLKELSNLPQPIASFSDGANAVMQSLKVDIEPVQSGSGDPSPQNVRPISGWTEEVITRTGKNLFDISAETTPAYGNLVYSVNVDNGTITLTGKGGGQSLVLFNNPLTAREYTVSFAVSNYTPRFFIRCFNANGDILTDSDLTIAGLTWNRVYQGFYGTVPQSFIIPNNVSYFYLAIGVVDEEIGEHIVISNIQLELGSTATTYEAYNGTTYTIPFTDSQGNPVEVYGGSVDVVNGIVTPAPYYASYNGENLTGEWISDRDVYSPNTTPTIGAQVVNIGATGTPFSVQPTSIKSLDGVNNVFASTGDVTECEYFSKNP